MDCSLCKSEPATLSARLLLDDGSAIEWLPVCEACLDDEGFCDAGAHYARRKIISGVPMLHDSTETWASCGDDHERLALRQIVDFAVPEGVDSDEMQKRIDDSFGPDSDNPWPQAVEVTQQRMQEWLTKEPEDVPPYEWREPDGAWSRRILATRLLDPTAADNRYMEQLLFRAMHDAGYDRVRFTLTNQTRLVQAIYERPSVSLHKRMMATLGASKVISDTMLELEAREKGEDSSGSADRT